MSETISPNSTIAQYAIVSKLGEGGMGEVWRARDPKLGRDVAIKVLPASLSADKDRLARFEQEAQAAGALNHPNILVIHHIGLHNGAPYIVSELLEGETLRERMAGGALPQRKATDYALQIAKGLAAAHEKGIIHRDIKPDNIFITDDGRVKILDFGLAKLTSTVDGVESQTEVPTRKVNTDPGTVMGTMGYISPEQLKGQPVDHRVDIFSFGAILYEMLSGKRAFRGNSMAETMSAILREDPPDLSATNKTISPAVERVVRHCLEKNPAERFHSARDLAFAIESLLGSATISGETATIAMNPARSTTVGLTSWQIAFAIAAVVAAVALAIVLWRGSGKPTAPLQFQKLTFSIQFITNGRFTPDGRTAVFSAARDRMKSELFVLRPEDREPRKLGGDNLQLLSISRSGELAVLTDLEYVSHRTYMGTLARMPLTDAPPRQMLDHVTAADWSPDGSELAVVRRIDNTSRLEYPVGTVLAQSPGYLSDVRISPNGELVAFMHHDLQTDNRGPVVIVNRKGAEIARSPNYRGEEGLAWAPDGAVVRKHTSGHREK